MQGCKRVVLMLDISRPISLLPLLTHFAVHFFEPSYPQHARFAFTCGAQSRGLWQSCWQAHAFLISSRI